MQQGGVWLASESGSGVGGPYHVNDDDEHNDADHDDFNDDDDDDHDDDADHDEYNDDGDNDLLSRFPAAVRSRHGFRVDIYFGLQRRLACERRHTQFT